ncbi:glycoside hydrolase family 2 protein [Yonghaparkia sp. Soil809]|uniref:glycoside hydrolase family 2 protein n=1 Tax=Yonghaparkia sp. Soil809 TaxID=1736417 RepID=UPI0006F67CC8|nr:hypothetical protein [Yonghaparkia sp. Soil809]KRF33862.1 hypothetical protein ASG83_03920 [Yonghaparkia sp. Soil809]
MLRSAGGPVPSSIAGRAIPASVPGVVHTDLLASGLIPDPYLGMNEHELTWIGRSRWLYSLDFDWRDDGMRRHDLACDGLDTSAVLRLNGVELGRVANQHRRYRFDVAEVLVSGLNRLEIEFDSALEIVEEEARRVGDPPRPPVFPHPFSLLRKSACNFGWDWGLDVVTAGIWRPIAIESWNGTRITAVRASARADRTATVTVDLEGDGEFTATIAGVSATGRGAIELTVPSAELWWPRSHGAQPLYDLVVETDDDRVVQRVGFRTVEIDSAGGAFGVVVNGEPVFVRGANWIPDDAFPSRVGRARIAARVTDAIEANMNLLRVWGGGTFEHDDFYDECDERGVLVWQDFLFACSAYPEEEPLYSEVAAEARDAVDRLASHPSIALWNGANENIWQHVDLDWDTQLDGRTWGERYYLELLPSIVAALDTDRPYVPNSPFSWNSENHPNDPSDGLCHLWDVWNDLDYTAYADHSPRFVSEFGFQGPPAWSTLTRAVHDEPLRLDGPQLLSHQKADDGQAKLARGLAPHLPPGRDFVDWHWATQLNQARAVRFGIRHFRSLAPYNQGSIVWQLNDCWPVVSWAAVDGDGVRKPLWFALQEVYADRIAIISGDEIVAINDSAEPLDTTIEVVRATGRESVTVSLGARSVRRMPLPSGSGWVALRSDELEGDLRLAGEPVDIDLSAPRMTTHVDRTANGYRVTVTAAELIVDLCLFPDRIQSTATVDRSMVSLIPGESATFEVAVQGDIDPTLLTAAPVLRSANDLFG